MEGNPLPRGGHTHTTTNITTNTQPQRHNNKHTTTNTTTNTQPQTHPQTHIHKHTTTNTQPQTQPQTHNHKHATTTTRPQRHNHKRTATSTTANTSTNTQSQTHSHKHNHNHNTAHNHNHNTQPQHTTRGPTSKIENYNTHDHGNMLLTMASSQMIEMSWWGSLEVKYFFSEGLGNLEQNNLLPPLTHLNLYHPALGKNCEELSLTTAVPPRDPQSLAAQVLSGSAHVHQPSQPRHEWSSRLGTAFDSIHYDIFGISLSPRGSSGSFWHWNFFGIFFRCHFFGIYGISI